MTGKCLVLRMALQLFTVAVFLTVVFFSQRCVGPVVTNNVASPSRSTLRSAVVAEPSFLDSKGRNVSLDNEHKHEVVGRGEDEDSAGVDGSFATSTSPDPGKAKTDPGLIVDTGGYLRHERGGSFNWEVGTQADFERETDADSVGENDADPERETDAVPERETVSDRKGETGADSVGETDADSVGETETDADPERETVSDRTEEANADSIGRSDADDGVGTDADSEREADADSQWGDNPDSKGRTSGDSDEGADGNSEGATDADPGEGTDVYSYWKTEEVSDADSERESDGDYKNHAASVLSSGSGLTTESVLGFIRRPRRQAGTGERLDHVNITTEDIRTCSSSDTQKLDVHAKAGVIQYTSTNTGNGSADRADCNIALTVCEECIVKFTVLQFLPSGGQLGDFRLWVADESNWEMVLGVFSGYPFESNPVLSFSNSVTITIHVNSKVSYEFEMTFTEAASSDRPRLELNYTSPSTGYIQSPGWNHRTHYPASVDSCVTINTSEQNLIFISYISLQIEVNSDSNTCVYDTLYIYASDSCTGDENPARVCGMSPPKPHVYATHHLSFRFVTDHSVQYPGFRLLFSFHNSSSVPHQLPDGKWNCSVPFWTDFRDHFLCTVDTECAGGEDKITCDDVLPVCGVELFVAGQRCYSYVRSGGHKEITWTAASGICARRGAYLASLNTQEEWGSVRSFLQGQEFHWVFVGLQLASPPLPDVYLESWQWADETIALYLTIQGSDRAPPYCAAFHATSPTRLSVIGCEVLLSANALCEIDAGSQSPVRDVLTLPSLIMTAASISSSQYLFEPITNVSDSNRLVSCPAGHLTRDFLACDADSACWKVSLGLDVECDAPLTPLPPSFACKNGVDHVPYSLVCDFRSDCGDSSDEELCVFPQCNAVGHFKCDRQQCIKTSQKCDGVKHCVNEADEKRCPRLQKDFDVNMTYSRAAVHIDGRGKFTAYPIDETEPCGDTHFQCPSNGYCLPVYVRCNDVYDCPGKEDEMRCERNTCPGYYRCRKSRVCLHPTHVCDGIFHCPEHDDELHCDVTCPDNCTCYGVAFFCSLPFNASMHPGLRFLDASGSGMTPSSLVGNIMLVHLNLARCGLRQLDDLHLPNLLSLDVSDNVLNEISDVTLNHLTRLQALYLSGNPLTSLFLQLASVNLTFHNLKILHVAGIMTRELHVIVYTTFPNVQHLNLSDTHLERIPSEGFRPLKNLRDLDVRGCPMTVFSRGLFQGLNKLRNVYAYNYKICCPATLPDGFNENSCYAPSDEVSSCNSLLRADVYLVFLSTFAIMAILGNIASFVYRRFISRPDKLLGYDVFVTHLSFSDFLMGVYLAIIGVADRVFRGNYLWQDTVWKNSAACKAAGFVSLLSSEVSAFIICLITLDRFLVVRFPFSDVRFLMWSANVACAVAWVAGLALAAVPLLPVTSHWQFYSQNGICLPLPITRRDFPGHDYAFGVMIVLNFILFLLIAIGQILVYWSITANRISVNDSVRRSRDMAIARRLSAIVMTDFLCWFPIGLLGLLASNGVPISGEANVVMAIFVLPLNSALNPFLYTFNMVMEKRRKARDERMQEILMQQLQSRTTVEGPIDTQKKVYTQTEAWALLDKLLKERVLSVDQICERFGLCSKQASMGNDTSGGSHDEEISVDTIDMRF